MALQRPRGSGSTGKGEKGARRRLGVKCWFVTPIRRVNVSVFSEVCVEFIFTCNWKW